MMLWKQGLKIYSKKQQTINQVSQVHLNALTERHAVSFNPVVDALNYCICPVIIFQFFLSLQQLLEFNTSAKRADQIIHH